MPRLAPSLRHVPGAVFSHLAARAADQGRPLAPLHIGDTWMEPPVAARMEALVTARHPGLHRYAPPVGLAPLREALAEKVRAVNGIPATPAGVLVTAGCTGAMSAAIGAVAEPGAEVLLLAPYWPLIRGIVLAHRVRPVEVPFYGVVDGPEAAVEAVAARCTPATVALYVSTPSNPTGRLLTEPVLAALAAWARERDLWILSDEVYEDYAYLGPHVSIAAMAPERVLTGFSFSKAYGMAGNRVGYLVGPPEAVEAAHRVARHTWYAAPRAGQVAALAALRDGAGWVARARRSYEAAGREAAERLGVAPPEGGTFLFLDVADQLDARGLDGFLEDCFEDGLLLAPGTSFGAGYGTWVRLCFTSAPPETVSRAVDRLASRLGRGTRGPRSGG